MIRAISFIQSFFVLYTYKKYKPPCNRFFLQRSLIGTSLAKQNPAKSSIHYIHPKLFTSNKVTSFRKNDNHILALFL